MGEEKQCCNCRFSWMIDSVYYECRRYPPENEWYKKRLRRWRKILRRLLVLNELLGEDCPTVCNWKHSDEETEAYCESLQRENQYLMNKLSKLTQKDEITEKIQGLCDWEDNTLRVGGINVLAKLYSFYLDQEIVITITPKGGK